MICVALNFIQKYPGNVLGNGTGIIKYSIEEAEANIQTDRERWNTTESLRKLTWRPMANLCVPANEGIKYF